MNKNKTEHENLNKLFGSMFNRGKVNKEPPAPTKEDLEKSFRIVFNIDNEPVFEEVKEED